MSEEHLLTLSCPDKPGIVHAITGMFAKLDINILDLRQFSDPVTNNFFMRVHFGPVPSIEPLVGPLEELRPALQMTYELRGAAQKTRVLVMVSKIGHCLNDLLFRAKAGQLPVELALVVSNHAEFESLAGSYGVPFRHLPVTKETKDGQEDEVLRLADEHKVELVVLARYMQVLSPKMCRALSGRIINIHHSFLPSFKGAKPYHQAYERGVKIIGATAHFVTADLDEGPIIEQRVTRVDHTMDPKELTREGSIIESQVLATAVRWYAQKRVFLDGAKTVVFN